MTNRSINLNLFSKYRDVLFGLSAISIMLFHYSYDVWHYDLIGQIDAHGAYAPVFLPALTYYALVRSIGVEIFLFLSGMGLYYSFSKNSDLGRFYFKRLSRVLIPYGICAGIFWIIRDLFLRGETFLDVLKDFSFYNLVTKGEHYIWFVFLIVILYLVYPLIHRLINGQNRNRNFLMLMIASIGLPILYDMVAHQAFIRTNIVTMRVPIFLLGCYMGRHIQNQVRIPSWIAWMIIAASLLLRVFTASFRDEAAVARLLAFGYSIGLGLLLVIIFQNSHRLGMPCLTAGIKGFLTYAGKYSLELYLLHVCLRNLVKQSELETTDPLVYALIMVASFLLAPLLDKASRKVNSRLILLCERRESSVRCRPNRQ